MHAHGFQRVFTFTTDRIAESLAFSLAICPCRSQNGCSMKLTKFPAVLLLVVVGGALVTYAAGQQKSAAVRFVPNGALLCGVQLSDEDWKALDKILKHFDRS